MLSTVEFDVLWEALELGRTPLVLQIPSPGRTQAERRQICGRAQDGLAARGLAGPGTGLAGLLGLLARPVHRFELRAWWGRSVRMTAAARDGDGVLAVRDGDRVVVRSCGDALGVLVEQLPPAPAGPGRAATVRTADLVAAGTAGDLRRGLLDRGVDPEDAGLLARMLGRVHGQAQLVAHRGGAPQAGGEVLTVVDTPPGRYLVTRSSGSDRVEWTTVAPTDARRLRYRAAALLDPEPDEGAVSTFPP